MTENQSSNEESSENQEIQVQETKMIPVATEINEAFYNFLKEYLAFFGSHMTVEDLTAQMIYHECRRLQTEIAEFTEADHYVGTRPWALKHPKVALTNGLVNEEDEDSERVTGREADGAAVWVGLQRLPFFTQLPLLFCLKNSPLFLA